MDNDRFPRRIHFQLPESERTKEATLGLQAGTCPIPAVSLAASVLAAAVCYAIFRYVILRPSLAGRPLLEQVSLTAQGGLQDMLVLSIAGAIAFAVSQLFLPRLVVWGFNLVAIVLVLWGALNIVAMNMLAEPVSWAWITYADILNSSYASDAIIHLFDAKLAGMIVAALVGYLLLRYLIRRLLTRSQAKASFALVLIFLPMFAAGWLNEYTTAPKQLSRGETLNPAVAMVQSFVIPADEGLREFVAADSGSNPLVPPNVAFATPVERPKSDQTPIQNVVLFVLESVPARFVEEYGSPYPVTPNLTKYGKDALRVERVYSPTPASNYALFALTTSVVPEMRAVSPQQEFPDRDYLALGDVLKAQGLRTGFFASTDNRFDRRADYLPYAGYDIVKDYRDWTCEGGFFGTSGPGYHNTGPDRCTVPPVLDWVDSDPDQPFFATFWTGQPHFPYFVEGEIEEQSGNADLDRFLAAVSAADRAFGSLMEGLEERGLMDDTLVVVVGDHGEAFGEHGTYGHASAVYEENLRVPLYFINPNLFEGDVVDGLAATTDVAATILDLLDIDRPELWQGRSLFDVERPNGTIFFSPWNGFLVGFVEGHTKVIYNASTKEIELFDLKADPNETRNLAPESPNLVLTYKEKLSQWLTWQAAHSSRFVNSDAELAPNAKAPPRSFSIHATGTYFRDFPTARISVDGVELGVVEVSGAISNAQEEVDTETEQSALRQYFLDNDADRCGAVLSIQFLNDSWAGEGLTGDTNLSVKWVEFDGIYYLAEQFSSSSGDAGGYWNGVYKLWRNGGFKVKLSPPSDCISDVLIKADQ